MPITYYSIAQFVPDPVAGERLNLAVIVFRGGERPLVRPTNAWNRVKQFAGRDVSTVRKFVDDLQDEGGPVLTLDDARRAAESWHYAIQLTEPQPSTLAPARLLADLAPRFLPDQRANGVAASTDMPAPRYRTRSEAVGTAYKTIREAVSEVGKRKVVKKKVLHSGRRGQHHFDVGAVNGSVFFLGQAISFEHPSEEKVSQDVDAAFWRLEDVRESEPKLDLALFAFVPRDRRSLPLFKQAKQTLTELDIDLVTEERLPRWSAELAERIAGRSA